MRCQRCGWCRACGCGGVKVWTQTKCAFTLSEHGPAKPPGLQNTPFSPRVYAPPHTLIFPRQACPHPPAPVSPSPLDRTLFGEAAWPGQSNQLVTLPVLSHPRHTSPPSPMCEDDAVLVDLSRHPASTLVCGSEPDVVSPTPPLRMGEHKEISVNLVWNVGHA